jgi:dTDP-4-dehydrorhamnose reductase
MTRHAPRRILIIGRGGQIAQALARHLPTLGHEVIALARPQLDLAAPESVRPAVMAHRPDIIINPAAYTAVDRAESEPELALRINRDGARAVAEAAQALAAPLIHLSTDYVFDGTKPAPYLEDDAPAPLGVYGASKLAGEEAVRAACTRHLILRTSWVFGAGGANFVRTMLRLARERQGEAGARLRVVADQTGAPSYAPDIAAAIGALLPRIGGDAPPEHLGLFHMTGAGETSWHGFAEAIMAGARARGAPSLPVIAITTADYPTPARRPANSRLDTGRLARLHGVSLPHWRDGLARCLDDMIGTAAGDAT